MVVRSLDPDKNPFRLKEEDEEILSPKVSYLSAIGAPMYLTNCTRPDISFVVNLLARFSFSPTRQHWNGIKCIFFAISKERLILAYSIQINLDMN